MEKTQLKTHKSKFGTQFLTALVAFVSLSLNASQSLAQGPAHGPAQKSAPQASGEKLDVTDLEKKYWAAKDSDFSVVQNRLFSKTGKIALSGNYGYYLSEPWSEGPTYGGQLNYYLSERLGLELDYSYTNSKDSEATSRLRTYNNGTPNHNKMKQFYGAALNFVPFYAKMSVLNSKIIYFDMAISPGIGMVEYEQQREEGNRRESAPALTLDVTQHFFITRHFALRLDLKNRWYQEKVVSWRNNGLRVNSTDTNQTSLLMAGFTLYY